MFIIFPNASITHFSNRKKKKKANSFCIFKESTTFASLFMQLLFK